MLAKKLNQNALLPKRNHDLDAGLDLFSTEYREIPGLLDTLISQNLDDDYVETLKACTYKFNVNVAIAIPPGKVGIICDKSGRGDKCIKTFGGIIDSGYTGPIMVRVMNLGLETWKVVPGTAIAQLIIIDCCLDNCEWADELPRYSERGESGGINK